MGDRLPRTTDICVVGGGIIGIATARELRLRHPDAGVLLMEREPALATHQSGHSSGVIHAGIYYAPGSLKARLCVDGAARLYSFCGQRGVDARRGGKVIVATEAAELPRLAELERRGKANGVPGLRRIDADELRQIEPHAAGMAALHSPATGIVDYRSVALAMADEFTDAGGRVATGCGVAGLRPASSSISVEHSAGRTTASKAVLCAGPWADRLAVAAGADPDPVVVPFRGAYLRLRSARTDLVRASIYPVPDPDLPFLGMHLTRNPAGEVLIGPTALLVGARDAYRPGRVVPRDLRESLAWPGTRRMMRRYWRTGLSEIGHAVSRRSFVAECRRYIPELRLADVERSGLAGVRAQAVARDGSLVDDFVISETDRAIHVRNAPSPAATCSLALAELIADRVDAIG